MRSHFQFLLCVAGLYGVALAQSTAPTISGLNPSSVAAGSAQFTLVVTGTNFGTACYATWNGIPLISALKSATEIDAVVPASDLTNTNGETAYVAVLCPPVLSNLVPFQVTGTSGPLTITTSSPLPQATSGNFYTVTFQATGGTSPYTWSLALGSALPTGLTLSPAGVLQGKPQVGQYSFNIQVTDSSSQVSVQQTFTLTVAAAGGFTITTPSPLPPATPGTLYSVNLTVSGGTQPYMWSLASGSVLPTNFALSTGGAITGNPTAAGQYSFTVQVTDSSSPALTAQQTFSLTVGSSSGGGLTITTSSLPTATAGQTYTTTLAASGGTPSYTWSAAPGTTLPSWLTLVGATGVLSGVPPAAGTFTVSVQVADSASHTVTKNLSLVVSSGSSSSVSITTGATLVQGTIGAPYYQILAASGGTQPYIWSALTALPPGLLLDPSGVLYSTPTAASQYTFTIQVSDSSSTPLTAHQNFSLTISAPGGPLTISTSSLPGGSTGQAYTATVTAYGGNPPYTWTAPSSTPLPSWLALDPNAGLLSGTPPTAATYTVAVQVTDSTSPTAQTASKSFSLSVTMASSTLTITTPSTLPTGMVGVAYSPITFAASGGMGPYTFVVFSGNSDGLAFGTDNVTFSGTPQAAGTFMFTVQVADSTGLQGTANFTLTVNGQAASPLTISTASLTGASAGQAYNATLTASGGTPPYTWSAASGTSLPSWLTLAASTGVLSGTPPAGGTFTISVQVTDSTTPTAKTASKAFTISIAAAPVSITTGSPLPAGTVGTAYPSTTLAAAGGTAPYMWSISGNTDGLSLGSTGILSGTPQNAGTFTFTVQVTDSSAPALQGSKAFTITVAAAAPLKITNANQLPAGTLGSAYSFSMAAAGGTPPYTWSAIGLAAGISINSAGLISGTISAAGTLSFMVQVTDSATPPATAQGNFRISVTPPTLPAITISGLPAIANPLGQYMATVAVASAYPVTITGTAILSSSPSDSGPSDGSIQFSGGGKSANFTINAGSTFTTLAVQTGSVAGTVTLSLSQLSAGGTDVTPTPAPSAKTQMAAAAPVITAATATKSGSTLTIQITGYATSRDMQQAVFTFSAASGQTLQTGASQLTVQLSSLFSIYFPQNASTGSQFVYSQPFTIQGDINSVIPQNVTLTNRAGSVTAAVQ